LHPDGEEHPAQHPAGDLDVLGPVAVDVGEVEEDLAEQSLVVVGDDRVAAGDLAVEHFLQVGSLGFVRVGGDDLGAFAEAGGLGDFLADEGVDEGGFADFFAADEADEVEALFVAFGEGFVDEDGGVFFEQHRRLGAGDVHDVLDELFQLRGHQEAPPWRRAL
jgi:hypothetical protein